MASASSSYPDDTVVFITDVIGGIAYQASGVLISPDEVLTAAHVVFHSDVGTASDIVVTPGYNSGVAPFGSATADHFHYFPVADPNGTIQLGSSQEDFAVIHLTSSFPTLGTMGLQADFQSGQVTVTGYPASAGGAQVSSVQTMSLDPGLSLLVGTALGEGSSGGPVWVGSAADPWVVGVVSSGSSSGTGFFPSLTTPIFDEIEAWVAADDGQATPQPIPGSPSPSPPPSPRGSFPVAFADTSTGQAEIDQARVYSGPYADLARVFARVTSDNVNISTAVRNIFITTGSGNDAITVTGGGNNVLDGGTGSNFLTGGTGSDGGFDTFFSSLSPGQTTWDTIVNFHQGDVLTIWNATQFGAKDWTGIAGASGFRGATLRIGGDRVTFAGISLSQAKSFHVQTGTEPGANGPVSFVALTHT